MTTNGDIYKFQIPDEGEGISEAELEKNGINFEYGYDQKGGNKPSEDSASKKKIVSLDALRRIEDFKLKKFGSRGAGIVASFGKAA